MAERIPVGPSHPNQYETLSLLKLYDSDGDPVYFVVSGSAIDDSRNRGNDPLDESYYFDEHSCPTNYVNCEAIMQKHNPDPHGVFDYVRSVWKPIGYESSDGEEMALALFPEINQ